MNILIDKELKNTKICKLPQYCDDTNHIIIEKGVRDKDSIELEVGKYYQIQLKDYIVNPPDNFTLHVQWNNNIIPEDNLLNVEVKQLMGKMIKVSGTGVNVKCIWTGWLPEESFIIEKVL